MFPERIETDRLILERLCHENIDLQEFYRVCSDTDGSEERRSADHSSGQRGGSTASKETAKPSPSPRENSEGMDEVTRYMPWDPHATINESKEFIDGAEKRWKEAEGADYAIRPAEDEGGAGAFAGVGSLHLDWDRQTGSLGMWLRKRFWGRGYSGERAAALMELAFERLDLEVVAVTHHADNEKSKRAIEKYVEAHGGQCEGYLRNWAPYGDEVADEYRYTVTQAEYRDATGD
ncbi:GNAT family N-acetyltransferase [Halococcus saccharolyticus]|uniref:GCN5-related N-acetyltransferase n=1 Tax=Halococcus saccharolyticus DSM 5350 TaxID=1227455 RepID=M0MLJ4_9EURY|nr:GNAT family N-acetyltransferase [Halococcus saccharolyticus]EMA46511.1 GCN5-related N-acetyltransferase [Halococcus saccharolyticus DSM 5350]